MSKSNWIYLALVIGIVSISCLYMSKLTIELKDLRKNNEILSEAILRQAGEIEVLKSYLKY